MDAERKPLFYVEFTRVVEFKGFMEIEADDARAAYEIGKVKVDEGDIYLKQVLDHTEIKPVREIPLNERWQQEMQRPDILYGLAVLDAKQRGEEIEQTLTPPLP